MKNLLRYIFDGPRLRGNILRKINEKEHLISIIEDKIEFNINEGHPIIANRFKKNLERQRLILTTFKDLL
ncbi:MAG: hypothetical protein MUO72_09540 [Bacteroidales bacterium]|nr:hypothetical protein [Bacteroidales bacterium]